ncbi:leydig cell tumor 10 kDa protein homolog [Lineus longissimus]|uniref:leydig cell tumor 10 kDa protein homolog n=1 Tax=Lineus longissimus TaxID=88925 RepID=UPI002B4FB466
MAQGKLKTKCSVPAGSKQKSQHNKRPQGPKKGARAIAPKKAKQVQASKLKKDLEKAIKKSIEEEVIGTAANIESKSLQILKSKHDKKKEKKK